MDFETPSNDLGIDEYDNNFERVLDIEAGASVSDAALQRSSLYARKGSYSMRAHLSFSNLLSWPFGNSTFRAELQLLEPGNTYGFTRSVDLDSEYYYGFSVRLLSPYININTTIMGETIAQWDHGDSLFGGEAPFSIELRNSSGSLYWYLSYHTGDVNPVDQTKIWYQIGPATLDTWVDFQVRASWKHSGGLFKLWLNGSLVVDIGNLQTMFPSVNTGPKFKVGLYCYGAALLANVTIYNTFGITGRTIFIDELRWMKAIPGAGESEQLAMVLPGQ